jgi:hypothetical protein
MVCEREAWCELFRTDDVHEALTVVTASRPTVDDEDDDGDETWEVGAPPYTIEVREQDATGLIDVLEMIRAEQEEFDRDHAAGRASRDRVLVLCATLVTAAPVAVEVWALLARGR